MGDAAVKVSTTGIDKVIDEMARRQQLTGEAAVAMLRAGGNVFQREWMQEADRLRHRRTGDMIKSISATNPKDKGDGLQVDIYPQGKNRKGTRNSLPAFVIHHARPGDKWVDGVVEKATDESNDAMADVWGKFIETGNVPNVKKLRKGQK